MTALSFVVQNSAPAEIVPAASPKIPPASFPLPGDSHSILLSFADNNFIAHPALLFCVQQPREERGGRVMEVETPANSLPARFVSPQSQAVDI